MSNRLLAPEYRFLSPTSLIVGHGIVLGLAGAVVDGGGTDEDEGVGGAGDVRGWGEGVDVVIGEGGGKAEGVGEVG